MKFSDLNRTTKNSMLDLYRGANTESIKMALRMKPSELRELQKFFGTTDIDTIARRCSLGDYNKD